MKSFPLALLVGFLAGFLGAIPPGPLNVTIIRKASHAHRRQAFRVAFGGALVDMLLCGAIGLGFAWILQRIVTVTWVKMTLALFLLAYGLKVLIWDRKRDAERTREIAAERDEDDESGEGGPKNLDHLHVFVGFFQGAANPTLLVNWTLLISFLVGHRILNATPPSAAGFAVGVGIGVFSWFTLLIEILDRLKDHPIADWLRRSTVLAGILLILFGLYFTIRSIGEL